MTIFRTLCIPRSAHSRGKTWEFLTDESAEQGIPAEPFEIVAADYCYNCYIGSMVDPVTGENRRSLRPVF
jgi:hypothetical protein